MQLKEYLKEYNLTVYHFASISKLSAPVIYRVLKNANIAPRSARRIKTVTNGVVDYKNIMSFCGAHPYSNDE